MYNLIVETHQSFVWTKDTMVQKNNNKIKSFKTLGTLIRSDVCLWY